MRKAVVAGTFYEKAESLLKQQIESCFNGDRGPGALPAKQLPESIKAIIVPHAGYVYSGQCAAWAYKALAESHTPDIFILIGPSHHYLESGLTTETFETPLGNARVNQDFARRLVEKGNLKQNEKIHLQEHSLEVQLPFLKYIYKEFLEKPTILPILLSHDADLDKIALDIKETLVETGLKACFIISSDFTHHGPNYKFLPFTENVKEKIYDLDKGALDIIKTLDADKFSDYIKKTGATICGYIPITLLLKLIKSDKVLLEQYYTSGDITGDYKNSVSYASLVFK